MVAFDTLVTAINTVSSNANCGGGTGVCRIQSPQAGKKGWGTLQTNLSRHTQPVLPQSPCYDQRRPLPGSNGTACSDRLVGSLSPFDSPLSSKARRLQARVRDVLRQILLIQSESLRAQSCCKITRSQRGRGFGDSTTGFARKSLVPRKRSGLGLRAFFVARCALIL